ncbi:MAG: magnesium transporter [Lachnospiraceae bacterium]
MSATMNTKKEFFSENTSPMLHPDYKLKIADIFRSNLSPKLKQDTLSDYHENDIAAALDLLSREERSRIYRILTPETLANILEYSEQMDTYLDEISLKQRVQILELLEVSAAADYLDQLEKSQRDVLLDLIDEDTRQELLMLSSFGEEAIGSKMSTNYIAFHSGASICQAMSELVEQAAEHDNISTLYVVDETGTYLGAINLKELIIARKDTKLDAITMTSYPYVYANEPIEDCISRIVDYSEDSIPVLDSGNKLRGVLTSQDLTELVDQEMGDDYAKLAGLASEEDLNEPLVQSIKKRLPWLIILLGLGLLVSSVVGIFEGVIASLPLIIAFQSLVLDMAGNVGTQSLAVTIRVLMDENINSRQQIRLIGKEARVGLVNGMILGLLSFLFIGLYLVLLKGQTAILSFSVSFCTGIALLAAMLLSSLSGTIVPLIFKKVKIDPAVASGPLITTINDLVAVVSYYGLAWLLLIHTLHL